MRKFAFLSTLCFFLAISIGNAKSEELLIPDGYSDYGSPNVHYVTKPMEVAISQLINFPESITNSGGARLELNSYFDRGDRLVIDVMETGLQDDAISGINRKYLFWTTETGRTQLIGYGYRHLCANGDSEDWTTEKC